MSRIARVVFPGVPHHVTQRGNRRAEVFFSDQDRHRYLILLDEYARKHALDIWAWCLMTNHVHFVVVPDRADSLAATFKSVDMRYSQYINRTQGLTGHLWQGRPYSCPLDETHLWAAVRYVERNPVRAGLVDQAEDWPWSSAAGHAGLRKDAIVSGSLERRPVVSDWRQWLHEDDDDATLERIRRRTRSGRPAGSPTFVVSLEGLAGRRLEPQTIGRPRKIRK
jgi:putative transposase